MQEIERSEARAQDRELPQDAPLMSIGDVAAYLRVSPAAVRKMIDGRPDGDDELGKVLRPMVVKLSPRRRYVLRSTFLEWLRAQAEGNNALAS